MWNRLICCPSRSAKRRPYPVVEPSTTAMERSPAVRPARRIWKPMMPTMRRGPKIVPIQNHLVRTLSTNSRRTTAKTLCMGGLPRRLGGGAGRLRSHQVDEDLVQRGRCDLEARQPRPGLHQRPQDHLGIGCGCEIKLGVLAVVFDLGDLLTTGKDAGRAALGAVERDDHVPAAMGLLDRADEH